MPIKLSALYKNTCSNQQRSTFLLIALKSKNELQPSSRSNGKGLAGSVESVLILIINARFLILLYVLLLTLTSVNS